MDLRSFFDSVLKVVEANPTLNEVFTEQLTKNEKGIMTQVKRLQAYCRLQKIESKERHSELETADERYKRELDRLVDQFLEREYWYSFRRIPYMDECYGKTYHWRKEALDITNCTWEGEKDILSMMELKLSHMIFNLRKYGMQSDMYIDSYLLTKEYCTNENDIKWAADKVIKNHFGPNVNDYKNTFGDKVDENDYINRLWLGPVESEEPGKNTVKYFLSEYHTPVKTYNCIESATVMPSEEGSQWVYDTIKELDKLDLYEAQKVIEEKNIGIDNIINSCIYFEYSLNVDWKDYKVLSPEMIKNIRGNIIGIRQLWQLRKYVKKLMALEDTNDKYMNMWENAPEDQKSDLLKKSCEVFMEDRKQLYKDIFDLMNEHGRSWWD